MGYTHDIFISYVRSTESQLWMERHFIPILSDSLELELGDAPKIFIDKQLSSGAKWPIQLAQVLCRSKIVISLWSAAYLHRDWCVCELSHICQREEDTGYSNLLSPNRLMIPVIVHDGNDLPSIINISQKLDVSEYYNPRMDIFSKKAEDLYDKIKKVTPDVANMIRNVPPYDPNWEEVTIQKFYDLFLKKSEPSQILVPRL